MIDALYIHVPFCAAKCDYCDFVSMPADAATHRRFVARLIDELRTAAAAVHGGPRTVFVGGGTPTVLGAALWRDLLAALGEAFDRSRWEEFTVEANPETLDDALAGALAAGGVTRLSIGAQSFDERLLRSLGRRHAPRSVRRAVDAARRAGIRDVNLDLIFGIPGQDLDAWRHDLGAALALDPAHLACYGLTIEPGTPLAARVAAGRCAAATDDTQAALYEATLDTLAAAGFEHYEISNWARPGRRCRHNIIYWTGGDWLALGPAASGHVDGLRWTNTRDVAHYLDTHGAAPVVETERLDADRRAGEQIMLRLRLTEGAPLDWLESRLTDPRREAVDRHLRAGLLERTPTHFRLTRRGLLLADSVLADLL